MADGAHAVRSRVIRVAQEEARAAGDIELELYRGRCYRVIVHSRSQKSHLIEQLSAQADAAVVMADGGLISNLRVWENLSLPLAYRGVADAAEIEHAAAAICRQCGYGEQRYHELADRLPAQLTLYERRLAGFVRAMLVEPEIIVYESVFDGLLRDEIDKVRDFNRVFRARFPFRTALYLDFDSPLLPPVEVDHAYHA